MEKYELHCFACDSGEARYYIESHKGYVVESIQSGDWITITYLAEKEL